MESVSENKKFEFKDKCPYCGSGLTVYVDGWVLEDDDKWKADSLNIECDTYPGFESEEYYEWIEKHTYLPYTYWMPLEIELLKWINERYEFLM